MSQAASEASASVGLTDEAKAESSTGDHVRQLEDDNSLEPGEVVTPPHQQQQQQQVHLAKDVVSRGLRKLTQIDPEAIRPKENGSLETPKSQPTPTEADDSEGLYSDTDSSGEEQKNEVEDVQQARKEKQAEAAAAAIPQPPPTPFLGISPLRFHMRAPCYDFPRMGFMPRMARGGPRGMRPSFFGRPPAPNQMMSPLDAPGSLQDPPGSNRPKSEVVWTALQPPVSFSFNLVSQCSNIKHKDCTHKAPETAPKPKEPAGESKDKPLDRLHDKEQPGSKGKPRDRSTEREEKKGKTRERSKERAHIKDKTRGKSKEINQGGGKARDKSRERDPNREKSAEKNQARRKTRERSRENNHVRGKTHDRSLELTRRKSDKIRAKTRDRSKERGPRSKERDQIRGSAMENFHERGKTSERSKERDQKRAKTKERSRSKLRDKSREMRGDRSKENPRNISLDKLLDESKEKSRDKSKEKPNDKSKERQRDKSDELPRERSREKNEEKTKENHRNRSSEKLRKGSREPPEGSKEGIKENPLEEYKEIGKYQNDKTRDSSKDNRREHPIDGQRERSRDKLQGQSGEKRREHFRDSHRGRSQEKSTTNCSRESLKDKSREQSRENNVQPRESSNKGKSREQSGEKHLPLGTPKENRLRREATPHEASTMEKSREKHTKSSNRRIRSRSKTRWGSERDCTPPTTQPQEQVPQTPPNDGSSNFKVFDIFADSPPRSNTAIVAPAMIIERSTTPPLKVTPTVINPTPTTISKPLLKASEIHSRIGALLEDNDLHLEALLATKEQLLRRTNEYKERKEIKSESASNNKERKSQEHHSQPPPRFVNPFKRESVLNERRRQRNGSHSSDVEENLDDELELNGAHFKEISIKIEKDLTPPPQQINFNLRHIKIERNCTPPRDAEREILVRNGAVAANAPPPYSHPPPLARKEQESPDTDDYIDNWENDDSMASMPKSAPPATPIPNPNSNASLNSTPLPQPAAQFNGDDDDSNALWNANSTPPPRSKDPAIISSNIHEMYDKFMNSIQMPHEKDEEGGDEEAAKNSSLSDESSSGSESSTTSSSSSGSDEDSSSEEENENGNSSDEESAANGNVSKTNSDEPNTGKEQQQKKNNVSKDLRKLKSLEDNLARIQMMRENYDAGDEISEELLKMESLFLMQRNAIMDKYRKQELKSSAGEDQQQQEEKEEKEQIPQPPIKIQNSTTPVNSIFDANREAIKLTISPLKLTRKSAILDKDEAEQPPPSKLAAEPPKKPAKEIAIVKPTIVESRSKSRLRSPPPPARNRRLIRDRSRSRSISRNRSRHRSLRPNRGKDSSRSPSPRRWRGQSPRRGSRFAKRIGSVAIGRSSSNSLSRSRTRSRSPNRRRRPPLVVGKRRRGSLSPGPLKAPGPRSPPLSRVRRSLSRERVRERFSRSRSPLPFKPPSPPMRRSWSHSHSRSPTRRRSLSRSRSRSRSPDPDGRHSVFEDYFEDNQGMEAAAYYYNMSLLQQEEQDPNGDDYDAYAAYMDSAYNMEQAYAQFTEDYGVQNAYGDYPVEIDGVQSPQLPGSVLRELPMAPVAPVAVQKGNVLEIVPTSEMIVEPTVAALPEAMEEIPVEDSKPKRKRVNFVDNVLPNYESDSEDRVVVGCVVERALRQYQERRTQAAAKLQKIRDELLALPAPPPPLTPKPANLEKPIVVQKKPKFRYFHYDPIKDAIVKSHSRLLRPNNRPPFDPKHFAMLMKSGRLPPLPPGFLRHRPPPIPAHVDPATRSAMLKEFFSKHPPPPLPMNMPMLMPMPDGMPYYLSGPPPMASEGASVSPLPVSVSPQPIPVLGYQGYAQPAVLVSSPVPMPLPLPVPVPVPVPGGTVPMPVPVPLPTAASTSPPARIAPFFTPPPLPELPALSPLPLQFTVNSVPTIREIMPVDILQQIGPLPKTLDVDDGGTTSSPEEDDENEDQEEQSADQPVVDSKPPLLVETQ
ncbi:hypothetical protein KR009_007689 [Drosophila setifemur]|nr:hypothetical protein KR009_007689 [Drosophila setifemur]